MSDREIATAGAPSRGRKRNSERTKREILTVASRLFARSGYSGVSLQEIATEVGVTAAMINHHFGSKLELFSAVAREEWGLEGKSYRLSEDTAQVAHYVVAYWNDPDTRTPALALARSLDIKEAVELFHLELVRRVFEPYRDKIRGADAEQRLKLLAGVVMGFGFFTTGALLDPDAPPLGEDELAIMEKYVARLLDVLTMSEKTRPLA